MKKALGGIIAAVLSLALILSIACAPAPSPTPTPTPTPAMPKVITITSYPTGAIGQVLATAFCDAIEKKTGIKARPTPSDTDVGRVLPVRKGEAQATIVTAATAYFVSNGLGEFSTKEWGPQKLRLVYSGNIIHHGMAVRGDSGIKEWADLKGKRVAFPPGLFKLTVPAFLAYGGLTPEDVIKVPAPGYVGGIKMVMEGEADACHACPISSIMKEWEAAPYKLRYMPMDPEDKKAWERMREIAPFMAAPIWVDYGARGIGGDKWLAYYPYTMTSYDFVSEDVIYTIVKAMDEGYDLYKDVAAPSSEQWTMKKALDLEKPVYIPFHSGFIKYAKEKGMWTDKHEKWQAEALKKEKERIATWKPKE